MRKLWLVLLLLPLGGLAYCSLPLTSVAVLTVTLSDQTGRKIDVDFLVIPDGSGGLRATQGIVHSIDGTKREYHLED